MKRIGYNGSFLAALIFGAVFFSACNEAPQKEDNASPSPITVKQVSQPTNTFLVISDAHLHKGAMQDTIPARDGDTGEDLWKITMEKFKAMTQGQAGYPKPDFVILLGDLPWHANPTNDNQLKLARESTGIVLSDLREAAQAANVPLIYSPGNNDSWSGDYRAFTAPNGEIPFDQDKAGTSEWPVINSGPCATPGSGACLADDSQGKLGCYSVYPLGEKGGLRIIVLNTVMFAKDDPSDLSWHYYGPAGDQQTDVTAQMKWFEQQFSQGNQNEAVLIGVHIPPGLDAYSGNAMWDENLQYNGQSVQSAFLEICGKNKDRIVGMLTSHTHMDGLRQLTYKDGQSLQVSDLIISIPGIAPGHGNNPGMKFFNYEPGSFELMDFTTIYTDYWSNETVASSWGNSSFSFNTEFGSPGKSKMLDWVTAMSEPDLLKAVESIYTAKGQPVGSNDVQLTLKVKPGN